MVFRFRRSVRLFPGVRVNLSKSGASVSVGPKGLRYTAGPKGTRFTAGLPGTGLSWTEYTPHDKKATADAPAPNLVPAVLADIAPLQAVENAPAVKLNELSASDLAPILTAAQRTIRFAPVVLCACIVLVAAAFNSGNQELLKLAAVNTAVFVPLAVFLDRYRRSVRIDYQPHRIADQIARALAESFSDLQKCARVWSIQAQGVTNDRKRNAGANTLIKRKRIYPRFKRPSCIRGSVSFPSVTIGNNELYFMPDAMLIVQSKSVAAMRYNDFTITAGQTHFIEDEDVAGDTKLVGQTWRYVNKNGGPDRRFSFNKQLPICLYGEIIFRSPSGLNGILELSNPRAGESFARVAGVLHSYGPSLNEFKSVKSFRTARHWISVLFATLFLTASSFAVSPIRDAYEHFRGALRQSPFPEKPAAELPANSQPSVNAMPRPRPIR